PKQSAAVAVSVMPGGVTRASSAWFAHCCIGVTTASMSTTALFRKAGSGFTGSPTGADTGEGAMQQGLEPDRQSPPEKHTSPKKASPLSAPPQEPCRTYGGMR